MIMVHSDNKGLVLPPKVAPVQVVIVPIYNKKVDDTIVDNYVKEMVDSLKRQGIRVHYDNRKSYRPGFKYNYYETMGVPVRVDIGPRDVKNGTCDVTRRDTCEKTRGADFQKQSKFGISDLLDEIHSDMYQNALDTLNASVRECDSKPQIIAHIHLNLMVLIPFCGDPECEESFKTEMADEYNCHMKSLCVPDTEVTVEKRDCVHCKATYRGKRVLFGKSY